jgi:fluoroacetyl-CoA thioesterase
VTGLAVGLRAELTRRVSPADTALSVGSGDLQVLATPRLLAWAEAATCAAVAAALDPQQTTVGTRVDFEHLRGSPVHQQVQVTAQLVHVGGRVLRFDVTARNAVGGADGGTVLAHGELTRVVVRRDRFMQGLTGSG